MRGDFHMHTIFSDGENTAEEMVLKAIELGFKEVGISDHAFTPPYDWSIKKDGQREYIAELKRLKEKYKKEYQGGILLIDELDATLHGFSQTKLVEYLWNAAGEYNIQIIFTTHSPIILNCVHGFQSQERYDKGTNLPLFAYDTSIVYLRPKYDAAGNRTISIQNVTTSTELSSCFCDINLSINSKEGKLNVYCEDTLATTFLKNALELVLGVMGFIKLRDRCS